jgi:hypothetical protein
MANVLICDPIISDAAVLAASASAANMPVTALQRKQLAHVWRPDDLTPWVTIDLGAAHDVRSVALISCAAREVPDASVPGGYRVEGTVSAAGEWRIRAAASAAGVEDDPAYDTGFMPFRQAGAEDSMPVIAGFHWAADGDAPRNLRYWRIDIADEDNAAGYLDFGRLYLSGARPFGINMSFGVQYGFDDPSRINRSIAGGGHAVSRQPVPVMDFSVDAGTEEEMMGRGLFLDRRRGISRDVLVLGNHENPAFAAQRTVYGTFDGLSPVQLPYFRIYTKRYRVRGINP